MKPLGISASPCVENAFSVSDSRLFLGVSLRIQIQICWKPWMCTELVRERLFPTTRGQGHSTEAHPPGNLESDVSQTTGYRCHKSVL